MSSEDKAANQEPKEVFVDIAGKRIGVRIDPAETYTTDQLAIEFGIPEYAFRERVRDGRLVGKKMGQFFFVTGAKVIEFLEAGFSFTPRPSTRRKGTVEEDLAKSREREARRKAKTKKAS
jgi:hypothetical protein